MSKSPANFQTYSPNYEQLSNRMDRLKRHAHSQSFTNIRTNSTQKMTNNTNLFSIESQIEPSVRAKRQICPHLLSIHTLKTEYVNEADQIITGRVTKNTGLKKYNQRQLKQVVDGKSTSGEKRQRQNPMSSEMDKMVSKYKMGYGVVDEIKDKQKMVVDVSVLVKKIQNSLIPGRIYTRQFLLTFS